jgi:hypothetical protein
LRWKFWHGENERWYEDLAQEGIVTQALKERPRLFEDLIPAWNAFWTLSRSRTVGFNGVNPIALSEIESYCRLQSITDPEERLLLIRYIQHMDGIYRNLIEEKRCPISPGSE